MRQNMWKNRLLVSIMVLVLIGAIFMPMNIGAEEQGMRANPGMSVTAALTGVPDVANGWYANETHNVTVTVTNTGEEELSHVVLGAAVYNDTTHAMEHDFGNDTTLTSLMLEESVDVTFSAWDPSMMGGYYIVVNAMAAAYPQGGMNKTLYATPANISVYIQNTTDAYAMGAGLMAYPYINSTAVVYANLTFPTFPIPMIMLRNNGSEPMIDRDVLVRIYNATAVPPELVYDETDTVTGPILPGETGTHQMVAWDDQTMSPAHGIDYFIILDILTADADTDNNLINNSFRIENITDVMPTGIFSHANGGTFNGTDMVFEAQIMNSGNMMLTEDFHVNITIEGTGGTVFSMNYSTPVDISVMTDIVTPGNTLDVKFAPITLPAGNYTIDLMTLYGLTGSDDDTTNNATGPTFTFEVAATESFEMTFNDPKAGKQEKTDIVVNVTITNTGSMNTQDIAGGVMANLVITDSTMAEVHTASEAVALAPHAMDYFKFAQWMTSAVAPGMYKVYVNVTSAAEKYFEDFINIEFPSPNGTAHFMVTPAGATEGATCTIGPASGSLLASGELALSVAEGGPYTATVGNVYNYSDASASDIMIWRETLEHIPLTMTKMTTLGTLMGYVVDGKGMPVEGATVMIDTTKVMAPTDTSNATGGYNLGEIEPGTVTVKAMMNGYVTNETEITVADNEDVMQNLTLNIIPAPVTVKVDVPARTMTEIGDEVLEGVSVDTTVAFHFDHEINVTFVDTNIKLFEAGTTTVIPGSWFNETNNTMNYTFTPTNSLDNEKTYNVTITKDLETLAGEKWYYDMDKTFQFMTEGVGAFPVSGKVVDTEGLAVEGIKVMVKDTMLNATSGSDGTFTIADVPAGTVTVMAMDLKFHDYLRYDASGAAAMNTSVAVVDAAVSLGDDLVVEEAALPISLVTPPDMINVTLDTTIVFTFSEAMNISLVEENFELAKSGGGNPIAGDWNVSTDNMTFTFTPGAALDSNMTYVITITKDIKGADGDPVFWKNYEATFVTVMDEPEPLTATIKVAGQALTTALTDIAVDAEITVEFSLKMDKTTADGNITVMTGTTAVAVTFSWDTLAMKVTLAHADLEKGTTYTVKVSTDLMSVTGMSLATAVSGQFTTASPVHTLKLMIEGEGSVKLFKGETEVATGTIANNEVTLIIADADYAPGEYTVKVTGSGDYKDKEWTLTLGTDDTWTGDGVTTAVPLAKESDGGDDDGDMTMIIVIVVIIIIIIVIMVMLAMRKKPEEEEAPAEEEEEVAGEFECPACGALVSADEKVCPECGEEFEEEEFKCPECDAPIEPDATTCEACGAEFELEEEGEEEGEEGELEDEEADEDYEVEGEDEDLDMEGEDEDLEMEGEEDELEGDEELEEDLVEEEDLDELDEEDVGEEDLEEDGELDKVE